MESSSKQKIGLVTAIIVGMNAMIGAGIFAVPATLAREVGPAGILTYAFVILAVLCMALTLARVAQYFPREGSFYYYAKQWGGHTAGVIAAASYIIGLTIAMGLLTQVAGAYLHSVFPMLSSTVLGITALATFIILNMIGVPLSQLGQMILICCTTFPLLATIVLCLWHADFNNLFPFMPYSPYNLITATRAVIFGFFGFESAASLFSIVKNPQKNVPRALTLAILLVGIIYILFVGSIILSIPLSAFSDPKVLISDILAQQFPHQRWIAQIINLSIISAVLGTLHSMIWSLSVLTVSFLKELTIGKQPSFARLTDQQKQRLVLIGLGIPMAISALTIANQDLFFSITGFFLVFAYLMGMGAIFKIPSSGAQRLVVFIGFVTAIIILIAALQGLVQSLSQGFISSH